MSGAFFRTQALKLTIIKSYFVEFSVSDFGDKYGCWWPNETYVTNITNTIRLSYSDILLVNDFRFLNFPFWLGFLVSVSAASPNALSTEKDDRNIGLCLSPKSPLFDRSTRSQCLYDIPNHKIYCDISNGFIRGPVDYDECKSRN